MKRRLPGNWIFLFLLLASAAAHADHVRVKVTGVDNGLREKLLNDITLTRQNKLAELSLARTKGLFARAKKEIRASLEARGYYQPRIDARLSGMEEGKEHWEAVFDIDPGPRTRITALTIQNIGESRKDEKMRAAFKNFPLQEGDALDHSLYESGKKQINNLATERGYFDAAWQTHVIRVDVSENSAEIELIYDSGPRYRFGDVHIPDTVVSGEILQNMVPFKTGDPYNANLLIDLTQSLRDSNYFADVLVIPELDKLEDEQVPVTLSLTPRPRNSYQIGAGFGTDTGPRLVGSWDNRYINRRGHRLETDLRLSFVLNSLSTSYLLPYFDDSDAELGFSVSVSHEETDTSISDTFKSGVRHLTKRGSWNETLGLTYQFESFELASTEEDTQVLMPSIGYWKAVSDDPIYTRDGFRVGMDLRGAVRGVVSSLSFLQGSVRAKYIRPIGERGRVISRGEFGGTVTSSFRRLPASLRFFAGGDNSVRGFDYESLGPKDSNGEVVGGRYLLTGSLEYEHRIYKKWSAAVFTDIGNAFNDLNNYELEYSVGTGIRWLSPVGLFRLDVAAGISREDVPIRLHIVLGPDL